MTEPGPIYLVHNADECRSNPSCAGCSRLRQMVPPGPVSQMAFRNFRVSIVAAIKACPMGALTLEGWE